MTFDSMLTQVRQYYDEKIKAHGPTALGVDWKSSESQQLRFGQLLKIIDHKDAFTLNDFGCGYGALADFLQEEAYPFEYVGFDISSQMITRAEELHASSSPIGFINEEGQLPKADYTVASGVFNVKLAAAAGEWEKYVLETLGTFNALSRKGFAFNVLSKYSDPALMRPDLYYADPLVFFDYCKTNFSRFVTLLHDYPLYEFTILVRQ